MTPETPPPEERDPSRPGGHANFGSDAAATVERSLAKLTDPDDALRILRGIDEHGAGFAAFLHLPDTTLTRTDLLDRFFDNYADAWENFNEFRRDVLEGLGWLQAVEKVMSEMGIPDENLTWNNAAIDQQIFQTYDIVYLDGWWHVFNK